MCQHIIFGGARFGLEKYYVRCTIRCLCRALDRTSAWFPQTLGKQAPRAPQKLSTPPLCSIFRIDSENDNESF